MVIGDKNENWNDSQSGSNDSLNVQLGVRTQHLGPCEQPLDGDENDMARLTVESRTRARCRRREGTGRGVADTPPRTGP